MGLASFNRMRLRRVEAMSPENVAKRAEDVAKEEKKEEAKIEEVKIEEPVKEVKEVKRGSKRK